MILEKKQVRLKIKIKSIQNWFQDFTREMLSIKLNSHCGNLTQQFSLVALESFGIF